MKKLYIDEARLTLTVASAQHAFYATPIELPDDLVDAIMAEQQRKYMLQEYLQKLREATHRRGGDPASVSIPAFLKEDSNNAQEPAPKPKQTRSRKARVSK